ncbi:MAG: (5-formylfuran-3-yl)methyl phosphate synthase [Acidobacteriota bacterium]
MRLLVSVASAAEAEAAITGGADVIDAKDPHAGALGPVSVAMLGEIHAAVGGERPVSAALGDAADEAEIERDAYAFIAAGALFVKVGFGSITCLDRVAALTAAAVRGAKAGSGGAALDHPPLFASRPGSGNGGVIAVGYADMASFADSASMALIQMAARAGAVGVLLDTADKCGSGLRGLMTADALAAWVAEAHDARLVVALAGKLTADDLAFVQDAGADIAGVRGAACDKGRTGHVTADRVRALQARIRR